MLSKFEVYHLAKNLHRESLGLKLLAYVKDQLERATLSIVLNVAEGSGKITAKDQKRFYAIALGSCRETQALIEVRDLKHLACLNDRVAACLYRLVNRKS